MAKALPWGYDAENRLVSVSGAASFRYAGDGTRLAATQGGITTFYAGTHYEWRYGNIKKYYSAGAQRVAMSDNGQLRYLLNDHLGSTSLKVHSNGNLLAEVRYKPWGESRYTFGSTSTLFRFTGQRQENSGGSLDWLMFYNAHYYERI